MGTAAARGTGAGLQPGISSQAQDQFSFSLGSWASKPWTRWSSWKWSASPSWRRSRPDRGPDAAGHGSCCRWKEWPERLAGWVVPTNWTCRPNRSRDPGEDRPAASTGTIQVDRDGQRVECSTEDKFFDVCLQGRTLVFHCQPPSGGARCGPQVAGDVGFEVLAGPRCPTAANAVALSDQQPVPGGWVPPPLAAMRRARSRMGRPGEGLARWFISREVAVQSARLRRALIDTAGHGPAQQIGREC